MLVLNFAWADRRGVVFLWRHRNNLQSVGAIANILAVRHSDYLVLLRSRLTRAVQGLSYHGSCSGGKGCWCWVCSKGF